jgi:hypothetical protein
MRKIFGITLRNLKSERCTTQLSRVGFIKGMHWFKGEKLDVITVHCTDASIYRLQHIWFSLVDEVSFNFQAA